MLMMETKYKRLGSVISLREEQQLIWYITESRLKIYQYIASLLKEGAY